MAIEKYTNGFKINSVEVGIASALSATYDSNGINIANQLYKFIHPNITELLTETKNMDVDDILSVEITQFSKLEIEYINALGDHYNHLIDLSTIKLGQENEKAFNNICYNVDSMIVDTLKYYFIEETEMINEQKITRLMFNLYPSNNEGTNIIIKQIYGIDYITE